MKVNLKPYQSEFLNSEKRFPAMVSAIGTGKTFMLLLKVWQFCEKYPDSLALVVRKEFTDLRDSTLKDFVTYFGVDVDGNKEYKFPNGSTIMFRHGGEIAVLKNMNLSIAGIEQAEEFETDETFTFIRDRLRRQNAPYRQLCVIANACGHNWIWKLWVNGSEIREVIDDRSGQIIRERGEYLTAEANIYANEDNLPKDFVLDMMAQEHDAPNHFLQYVMNCHEEVDADDLLFKHRTVYDAPDVEIPYQNRSIKRVMGLDVARFGQDKTVFTILEQKDLYRWEQVFMEQFHGKETTWITGYAIDLEKRFDLDLTVVDDVGVGGGVTDGLRSNEGRVLPFVANGSASISVSKEYEDSKTEGYFMLRDLLTKGWLKLLPDVDMQEQLMTIRFKYKGARKMIVGKEEMRRKYKELKSPDMAEALMMAVYGTDKRPGELDEKHINLPKYAITDVDIMNPVPSYREGDYRVHDLPAYGRTN